MVYIEKTVGVKSTKIKQLDGAFYVKLTTDGDDVVCYSATNDGYDYRIKAGCKARLVYEDKGYWVHTGVSAKKIA
jgi:hypothetical protein